MSYKVTTDDFTKVNHDVNGNPRYVMHFLALADDQGDISGQYARAIKRANKIGGRKFHNKQYGGGIVFTTYGLEDVVRDVNKIVDTIEQEQQA